MDTDRLICRGESTSAEWLKECADLEHGYDDYPQEKIDGSAAKSGWPYDVPSRLDQLVAKARENNLSPAEKTEIQSLLRKAGEEKQPDLVNSPSHYTQGKWEVIEVAEDWFPTEPLLFQAAQYMGRCLHKGQFIQDLEKTIWMINRRIANFKRDGR